MIITISVDDISPDDTDMMVMCFLYVAVSELREQRRTDSGEESLDALEEVFERIQTVTGEDNLDMLVTRFIQGRSPHQILTFTAIHKDNAIFLGGFWSPAS